MSRVPGNHRPINQGGLFRCCVATVLETDALTEPGMVLDCKYEPPGNAQLVVSHDGVWEWNRP